MRALTTLTCSLALLTVGCSTTSPDVVPRSQAQQLQTVRFAKVESVRLVKVDGQQSGIGAAVGAVTGGIAGSSIGGRRENIVGGVLLGVGGAVLGNAIERAATTEEAFELTLVLENGSRSTLVQAKGSEQFRPGDRVKLIGEGSKLRVTLATP
jgi:outer membrane lipoprotein SlyB